MYRKKRKRRTNRVNYHVKIRRFIGFLVFCALIFFIFSTGYLGNTILPFLNNHNNDRARTDFYQYEEHNQNNIIGIDDIIFSIQPGFRNLINNIHAETLTEEELERLRDVDYFVNNFYIRDHNTGIIHSRFDIDRFMEADFRLEKDSSQGPQVLIFHVHGGSEFFVDSDLDDIFTGVVGAGARLKYYLEYKHGISTLHHTELYDVVNGVVTRAGSYERMEEPIRQLLADNPSIQVVIDLHRDGIDPNPNLVTYIDGKPYARLMFVNGVSALNENGIVRELSNLVNPNLDDNLAFSFAMQTAGNRYFPNLMRRLYLKPFRFSTHLKPRSLLVEVGSQHNTMEEAFNSMELLADLINEVVFTQ